MATLHATACTHSSLPYTCRSPCRNPASIRVKDIRPTSTYPLSPSSNVASCAKYFPVSCFNYHDYSFINHKFPYLKWVQPSKSFYVYIHSSNPYKMAWSWVKVCLWQKEKRKKKSWFRLLFEDRANRIWWHKLDIMWNEKGNQVGA